MILFSLRNQLRVLEMNCITPLPNETLYWFRLKARADDKINVTQRQVFFFGPVENIAEK